MRVCVIWSGSACSVSQQVLMQSRVPHVACRWAEVRAMESAAERMLGSGADGGVSVTLDNEAVWSRSHSLGTEMILTAAGRRMFPCCRFRLTGLQPGLSYLLILDIAPVDDLRHRWTGLTWEPDADGESPGGFRDGASAGFKINLEKTPRG